MSVSRYNDQVGYHYKTSTGTYSFRGWNPFQHKWGGWTTMTSSNGVTNRALRMSPHSGNNPGTKWRTPTSWAMFACNVEYNDFDYESGEPGTLHQTQVKGGGAYTGINSLTSAHVVPTANAGGITIAISSNTVNRANVEALNKIKSQNVNFGEALGESKKTFKYLLDSVNRVAKPLLYARHGRFSDAIKALGVRGPISKTVAQFWLEYQYALLPLMSDIHGAQKQLKDGFKTKDQLFSVVRQVTEPFDANRLAVYPGADLTGSSEFFCKVKYYAKISNPSLYALNQLGLINPASIAWELTPYSFVVDWLLPVGNLIDGVTATLGVTFTGGFRTIGVKAKVSGNLSTGDLRGNVPHGKIDIFAMQRVPLSSWGPVVPYYKNPFTSTHAVTSLALLRQLKR